MQLLLLATVVISTSQMNEDEIDKLWDAGVGDGGGNSGGAVVDDGVGEAAAEEPARYAEDGGAALNDAARKVLHLHETARSAQGVRHTPDMGGGGDERDGDDRAGASTLTPLPPVSIHPTGTYKFVLIEVTGDNSGAPPQHLLRSISGVEYHADVYEEAVADELKPRGLGGYVLGGGRLVHTPAAKKIDVYGYSKTFGRCVSCNEEAAMMLRQKYPEYKVTWSNEGY